jgi:hypothetical protein
LRLAVDNKRWVALILVVGLLAVALTLVCSEGVHLPFLGGMDGKCAVMSHSGSADAIFSSDSAHTLVSQLLILGVALVAFTLLFEAPARLVLASASPSPPPDPRFGRLRL